MKNKLSIRKNRVQVKQFTTIDIANLLDTTHLAIEIQSLKWIEEVNTMKPGIQSYHIQVVYEDGSKDVLHGEIEVLQNNVKTFNYEPYVAIPTRPINAIKDYHDYNRYQEIPLYHTFISDGPLRIMITVIHNDTYESDNEERAFQVVSYDGLYLESGNSRYKVRTDTDLSVNPEITQAMFSHILDKYSIVLEKVIMHDYTNFEVPKFYFSNAQKQRELEDIINKKFNR